MIPATIRAQSLPPAQVSPLSVPAGRWALSPLSTVPLVELVGAEGPAIFSWGQAVETTSDGRIKNASRHAGDVVLVACPCAAPTPPRAITVPATFTLDTALFAYVSREIDVRFARRVFLTIAALTPTGVIEWVRLHRSYDRGTPFDPGTSAVVANAGVVVDGFLSTMFHRIVPCGIASGEPVDTSPAPGASLQSVVAHALLDTVQVRVDQVDIEAHGYLIAPGEQCDAFFVLEY